jgi:hypothetical protein
VVTNFKKKTARSKKYMAWIRTLKCRVSDCYKPAIPHHAGEGGVGLKCSDYFTLPLCDEHHKEHDRGSVTFYDKYSIDKWKTIAELEAEYIELLGRCK